MLLKKIITVVSVTLLLFCTANLATAEIKPGAITISPMVGQFNFDSGLNMDEDSGINYFTFGLGYNIDKNWAVEGLLGYTKPTFKTADFSTTVDTYQYEIDALYHFLPDNKLVPYLVGGVGGITYDPNTGDGDTDVMLNVGGGLKLALNDTVALRADVRRMIVFDAGGEDYNWSYLLGVTMAFGAEKEMMTLSASTPAPEPVLPCSDGDNDGICDKADNCPDTPKGCRVDSFGCPFDDDRDGIIDCLDKCPKTPAGAVVDSRGCWVISVAVLFDFDSSDLKPAALNELDKVYEVLKADDLKIEVQGYTCNMGPDDYNQNLSERRAQAVTSYLIDKGIDLNRLTTVGYGESNPAVSNDTKEGRIENRRVEFNTLD